MTSKSEKQAGDIIYVRLLSTHIMVISREREERRVTSKSEKQAGDII